MDIPQKENQKNKMNNQLPENNISQDGSEKTENVFEVAKKPKIPKWVIWVVLGAVVLAMGIVVWWSWSGNKGGAVWWSWKTEKPIKDARITCQQDSDCVLAPQYQGCCPKECKVEAVNVETEKSEEEARNKVCSVKDYFCKFAECKDINKQVVCEQNRCVDKNKLITENQSILNGLQFSVRPEKTSYQYKKDEPIIIHGEFKNITNKNIYFYTPEATLTVTYEILDTKRKKIEIPSYIADPALPEKKDFILIKPGESLPKTFQLYLGIGENVFAPGIYSVAVVYNIWQKGYYENGKSIDLNGWNGKIKSNFIELNIESGGKNLNQSTLKNYKIIGSFISPGESSFVKVVGNTAYLTDIPEGLLAIDVSNPEKPVLLDKIKIAGGGAYALAVNYSGLFAVASGYGNSKVVLIDIRDSRNLRIMGEIDAKRSVQDMVVIANYVYLAIDGPEVEVLTLKFTESIGSSIRWLEPTLISKSVFQIQGGGHAIGLAVLDINKGDLLTHNLIIAQGESGAGVYKKAEVGMPQFNFTANVGYVNVVDADEKYVYAGVGNAIKVIDLKTQKEITTIKVDDVLNFKVKDRTLYVASGEKGVQVLDISDIKNPKQIALIDTPGRARSVDVSMDGKYIYVADDRDDLQIIQKF